MNALFAHALRLPRRAAVGCIRVYQRTFSPDHGLMRVFFPFGACRFHPSCSEYMVQAVDKLGIIRGFPKGVMRLLRCTPWAEGGNDPLR